MDGRSRNEDVFPQILNLISKGKEEGRRSHNKSSEERELELRLGPPGEEDWSHHNENKRERDDESPLSLGYFSTQKICHQHNQNQAKAKASSFLRLQSSPQNMPVMGKESKDASQPSCPKVVEWHSAEKKAFSPSSANTAVPKSSQKRTAPGPVVGWPPIRSSRKNLASGSSSKHPHGSHQQHHLHVVDKVDVKKHVDNSSGTKGLFVKINMDGVPIGRKVDINAYGSYDKLSSAVDELFRGLLAAQRDSSVGGLQNKQGEEKAITGLLDGSGEYTLVYQDNEGDRMLVGDVPWHMFVSTVKRLRVLKSSDLSAFSLGSEQDNMHTSRDKAMK